MLWWPPDVSIGGGCGVRSNEQVWTGHQCWPLDVISRRVLMSHVCVGSPYLMSRRGLYSEIHSTMGNGYPVDSTPAWKHYPPTSFWRVGIKSKQLPSGDWTRDHRTLEPLVFHSNAFLHEPTRYCSCGITDVSFVD